MHSNTSVLPSWPRAMPTIAMIATAVHASRPKIFVMLSSSRCSGERTRLVAVTMSAMRPICVACPVSVTTKLAVPRVTCVFWNTRFVRSPSATSPAASVARSFATGALSPVSAASCSSSVAETMTRPSAGTTSPASSSTTSPGTRLIDSIASTRPKRRTRACGTCSPASASTLARALSSCRDPITTLNVTSSATKIPVATCPMAMLATATIANMMFIGLESWPRATDHKLGGGSVVSLFGPYCASRRSTSSLLNPWSGSTPNRVATSSVDNAYHAMAGSFAVGSAPRVVSSSALIAVPPIRSDRPRPRGFRNFT